MNAARERKQQQFLLQKDKTGEKIQVLVLSRGKTLYVSCFTFFSENEIRYFASLGLHRGEGFYQSKLLLLYLLLFLETKCLILDKLQQGFMQI